MLPVSTAVHETPLLLSPSPTQCNKELAGEWRKNQNGPGFACLSCYCNFGTGKKAKAAADPRQTAITQFFKKQKQ